MSNTEFNKIIVQINGVLQKRYAQFKGTYFFGSRLNNNFRPDSDFDIVLVFANPVDWKIKKEIFSLINEIEIQNDIYIDTHIYALNDILYPITPFRFNVQKDGRFYAV